MYFQYLQPVTFAQQSLQRLRLALHTMDGLGCWWSLIDPKGMTFKQYLRDILESGAWHLVHFAGHSAFASDGNGYLFLPDAKIEVLEAKYFASWMSSTQFLFLSSCHSSTATFVRDMARMAACAICWRD